MQSTQTVYENQNPIWNEAIVLRGEGDPKGFMFITVIDGSEDIVDQISVPINFLELGTGPAQDSFDRQHPLRMHSRISNIWIPKHLKRP